MSAVRQGYLVLADITGYTSYTASTELTHSQEILKELLETVIAPLSTLFVIAEVEGDAVFAYGQDDKLSRPETILEIIELTYGRFRQRLESMRMATTCECRACSAISTLDLKFISHYGEYALQEFHGLERPFGHDVNVVHRLLKNSVTERTGWRGYALFSQPAADRLQVALDEAAHFMTESFEHIGDIPTVSVCLADYYARFRQTHRSNLSVSESDFHWIHDFAAPASVVWEWLAEPERRSVWMSGREWKQATRAKGNRTRVGSQNHCAHGKSLVIETILDWEPLEYMTLAHQVGNTTVTMTYYLTPIENGTRVTFCARYDIGLPSFIRKPAFQFMMKNVFKLPLGFQRMESAILRGI